MSYILKLAGWYPSRVDVYNGDFVQRQAQAISLYRKVIVLFLTKDPSLARGRVEVKKSEKGNLIEYIVYYSGSGIFGKALSLWKYLRLARKMVDEILAEHGRPALVHVNVVWKAGLIARSLKRRLHLSYLVTEHWTGYYKQDPSGLRSKGWFQKRMYRKVFREASLFAPVSADLGKQVSLLFGDVPYEPVYNAVNTEFFHYDPSQRGPLRVAVADGVFLTTNIVSVNRTGRPKKRLIHVSTFSYQKNIEGLLRVIRRLSETRDDFDFVMVGPCPQEIEQELQRSGLLGSRVFLTGEISYPEVAVQLKLADLMVLFSRFENLPCVLAEGFCCGLPAIATNVGGIAEIIDEKNGMMVEPGDEAALLEGLHNLLDHGAGYDREGIAREGAAIFGYPAIGKKFETIYSRIEEQRNAK